jgi:membrane-bound ClpP family serine protease
MIDLGLAPFVQRVLDDATAGGAAAVILEINTFGGRVDAAVLIRDALLRAQVPTVAWVNTRAISAGALIGLAAETLAMASGGTIGAATPVQLGQPGAPAQPVAEKTLSYMRKEFRATAESRERSPLMAEAMVDAGTAYEVLSIDIADVDVGENIGAELQIDQADTDKQIAQAKAEERRAMADAFRHGHLGIMDYYRMKNVQADTAMRETIAGTAEEAPAPPPGPPRRP